MKSPIRPSLILSVLFSSSIIAADKKPDPVAAQKERAETNWKMLDIGSFAHVQTKNLLIYAPPSLKNRLAQAGSFYEKCYNLASNVLFTTKDEKWKGKLTIFLFAEPAHFGSFVRRVEKRRVEGTESASFSLDEDKLHLIVCPPRGEEEVAVLSKAAIELGRAILQQRAGPRTLLPSWLRSGFGTATYYRALGAGNARVKNARKTAARLALRKKAEDIWSGNIEGAEEEVLNQSLADFLIYGPGKKYVPALLKGFLPGENERSKTFQQALESAGLSPAEIGNAWPRWTRSAR